MAIITRWHMPPEKVRVSGHPLFGIANLHGAQQLQRLRARFIPRHSLVGRNRIGDLVADGTDRIERRARVLEDHRHRRAVQMAEIAPDIRVMSCPRNWMSPAVIRPAASSSRVIAKPVTDLPEPLADEAEHLALAERQRDATHRLDKATPCREGDVQIA